MFVMAVDDEGEERNFLVTSFNVRGTSVVATICGVTRRFATSCVIGFVSVETMLSVEFDGRSAADDGTWSAARTRH
jgi:plastocyanin domain-containing protein